MAFTMGSLNRTGSVTVRPMPSGWAAVACSMREAVFSRSNLSGPRMVTSTPISSAAVLMPSSTVHQNASQAHKACCTMISLMGFSPTGSGVVGAVVAGCSGAVVSAGVVGWTTSVGTTVAFGAHEASISMAIATIANSAFIFFITLLLLDRKSTRL